MNTQTFEEAFKAQMEQPQYLEEAIREVNKGQTVDYITSEVFKPGERRLFFLIEAPDGNINCVASKVENLQKKDWKYVDTGLLVPKLSMIMSLR